MFETTIAHDHFGWGAISQCRVQGSCARILKLQTYRPGVADTLVTVAMVWSSPVAGGLQHVLDSRAAMGDYLQILALRRPRQCTREAVVAQHEEVMARSDQVVEAAARHYGEHWLHGNR